MIIKIPSLNIPHKVYIQRRYNFISISSPALLQLRHEEFVGTYQLDQFRQSHTPVP